MSTSVPIHTNFNLQKELCYFQNRLQSTMTDLRPLMGLHFECVSVSCSPGLDSKGLHQRKLPGGYRDSNGVLLITMLFTYIPPLMPLTNLCVSCFDLKSEHWWYNSLSSYFHPPHPSIITYLSETQHVFSQLLSHETALFLLTSKSTDFYESQVGLKFCVRLWGSFWSFSFGLGFCCLGFFY